TKLARDDRGVTRASTPIRNDRGGALHDRLPIRIRHVRNQHVAALDARHVFHISDHTRWACADSLADAATRRENLRATLERVTLDRAASAALHGLWPSLQDKDVAGRAVLAPLDIHRLLVVLFDDQRLLRERDDVCIVERELLPIRLRHIDSR